jgi:hypothetical protein
VTRDQQIVALYRSGKSAAVVGRFYLLTERRVLQILDKWGEPRRRPKPTAYLDLRRKSA